MDQGVEQEARIDNIEHNQVQENSEQIVTDESDGMDNTESEGENEASIDDHIIEDACIDAGEHLLEEDRTQTGVEVENEQQLRESIEEQDVTTTQSGRRSTGH